MKLLKCFALLLLVALLPLTRAQAAFRSAATSVGTLVGSTWTSTAPAGYVAGDILVVIVNVDNASQTITFPAGWTQVSTDHITNGDGETMSWGWKVATGTDAFNFSVSISNIDWSTTIAAYSGRNTSTTIDVTPSANNPNSATPPNSPISVAGTGITPVTNGCDVIWMAGIDPAVTGNGAWVAPSGMTLRSTTPSTNFAPVGLADLNQTTAAATGTLTGTWTQSGDNGNFVGYVVALRPAAGAARKQSLSLLGVGI